MPLSNVKSRLRIVLYGKLAFSLFLSPSLSFASQPECNDELKVHLGEEIIRRLTPFAGEQSSEWVGAHEQELDLSSIRSNHFSSFAEVRSDSGGNSGIFSYVDPNGNARIVKRLNFGPWGTDSRARLEEELVGCAWGESEGGPKLLQFGLLKDGRSEPAFYVEIEWLFASERAFPLKLAYQHPEFLKRHGAGGLWVPEIIADQAVHAFTSGLDISDPDLMISESGQVRWMDTSYWRKLPLYSTEQIDAFSSNFVLLRSYFADADSLRRFLSRFIDRIIAVKAMSSMTKEKLLEQCLDLNEELDEGFGSRLIAAGMIKSDHASPDTMDDLRRSIRRMVRARVNPSLE